MTELRVQLVQTSLQVPVTHECTTFETSVCTGTLQPPVGICGEIVARPKETRVLGSITPVRNISFMQFDGDDIVLEGALPTLGGTAYRHCDFIGLVALGEMLNAIAQHQLTQALGGRLPPAILTACVSAFRNTAEGTVLAHLCLRRWQKKHHYILVQASTDSAWSPDCLWAISPR